MPSTSSTKGMPNDQIDARPDLSILGTHPPKSHAIGAFLDAKDSTTETKVPHRALSETNAERTDGIATLREMLHRHHVGNDAAARDAERRGAMRELGFETEQAGLRRFPVNPITQKGNLAEIVLAEYLIAARKVRLPVYRLRFNPNVDQSMKGDDVIAFDLDTRPPRIIVGEAKYRATATKVAVGEIVEALVRSHKAGIPVSLQFVADRLFDAGDEPLAKAVLDCARRIALGTLQVDYVGLLVSDDDAHPRVHSGTPAGGTARLAMMSLSFADPDGLVDACYRGMS